MEEVYFLNRGEAAGTVGEGVVPREAEEGEKALTAEESGEATEKGAFEFVRKNARSAVVALIITVLCAVASALIQNYKAVIGFIAGYLLSLLNYLVMSYIIDQLIPEDIDLFTASLAKVFLFFAYHLRFAILIILIGILIYFFGPSLGLPLLVGLSILRWTVVMDNVQKSIEIKSAIVKNDHNKEKK